MKVVLKIGGSLLYNPDGDLNTELIENYLEVINRLIDKAYQILIVVGGGKLARKIIKVSRKIGGNFTYQDLLGVEASRMHALLFISALKNHAYGAVPRSFDEALKALSTNKIVVSGGLQPGQSTNAVSALLAELWEADIVINLSDVEKVYDKDPDKYSDAKAFDKLTMDEFYSIIIKQEEEPGNYALFDKVGCEILKRSKKKIAFVNGRNPENILKVLNNEQVGTIVE